MSENEKKKGRILTPPRHYQVFLAAQFFVSAFFVIYTIDYLPAKYIAALIVALSALLVVTSMLALSYRFKFNRFLGRLLAVVLCVSMVGGTFFIKKGDETIEDVANDNKVVVAVSVVVLKDSSATKLKDVKNGVIGYNKDYDGDIIKKVKSAIKKKTKVKPNMDAYSQYKYLADGLYGKQADAIVFNEAYRSMLEAGYKTFTDDTRILTTFNIEIEEELASTAVADVTKDCFVAYISGIDTRGKITGTRSDSNMLVIVNPTTHQILLLGIPRDYYVTLHTVQKKDKLTHSGLWGIQETVETLQDFLGITINYRVRVNFNGAIDMIDAVGGVDVYSPVAFTTVSDKYEIAKGNNHMDGKMALYFMRSRKMLKGGDNARVTNQIRVIKALMNKMMSFTAVTSFTDILNVVKDNVQTNMTSDELKSLFKMQVDEMPSWEILNYQLSGSNLTTTQAYKTSGTPTYVMEPDEKVVKKAVKYIKKMQQNEVITISDDNSLD